MECSLSVSEPGLRKHTPPCFVRRTTTTPGACHIRSNEHLLVHTASSSHSQVAPSSSPGPRSRCMHQPLPPYWLSAGQKITECIPVFLVHRFNHDAASTLPIVFLLPSQSVRIAVPRLCILQGLHDDVRNAFCPPICHMVSFLVMLPADLLHNRLQFLLYRVRHSFSTTECIVFGIFPCLSPSLLPKEKYPFIHVSATQVSPHS